ncbi:MAG: hypothetical protein JJU00_07510 [Opitutales bacterium]|nr:hypothetical protein [Opitutales bacterium]
MYRKKPTRRLGGILLLSLALGTAPLGAESAAEIQRLRAQIAELSQRLDTLETSRPAEPPAAAAANQPTVALGASGLRVSTPDRKFDLRVNATVHVDGRFYFDGAPGTAPNDFLLRRVRPRLRGTFNEDFSFDIQPEFAGNSATLLDANINWRITPAFQIRAGQGKAPVGLERLKAGPALHFIERAYATSLLPNRDVGLMLHGNLPDSVGTYAVSLSNGTADGSNALRATAADNRTVSARLFLTPFAGDRDHALSGLGLGIAGTHGKQDRAPAVYRTIGQQTFFSWAGGTTADGEVTRFSPQAYFYSGPLGIVAEYAHSAQDVSRVVDGTRREAKIKNDAWNVLASYFFTGEANAFGVVNPSNPWGGDGIGAFEGVILISQLNIDADAFPLYANVATSARRATTYGAGINWHLNRNVKASLNYTLTEFSGGENGNITARDEKALFTRLQFAF